MIYKVPVSYEVIAVVEVEADSFEDLMSKLEDPTYVAGLPAPDGDILDDTYEVIMDAVYELNH